MSDPNEQSEATQQEAGSTQANAEGRVEATEAAERKAQELGVDLTNVAGTGSGGRVTATDVENAYQQTDTTARSAEAIIIQPPTPCSPPDPTRPCTPCSGPDHAGILEQYAVLKATLAGPEERDIDLTKEIVVEVDDKGNATDKDTIIDKNGRVQDFPPNPCNFFAPSPLSNAPAPSPSGAPVFWRLPAPQPLGQPSCLTPCQGCTCEDCFGRGGEGCYGVSRGKVQGVSQHPLASFYEVNTSG